jgi:hypothetical protein
VIDNVTRTMYSFDGSIYYIIGIRKDIRYCIEKEPKDSVSMTFQPRCAHSFKKTNKNYSCGNHKHTIETPIWHHSMFWGMPTHCHVKYVRIHIGSGVLVYVQDRLNSYYKGFFFFLQFSRRIFQYIMRTTSLSFLFQKILLYQILDISYCCIL